MSAVKLERERGVTLVELTVVMFMLSIVSVILFAFLASVMKTTTRANKDVETEKAIELALRPLTEDIRGATSIATAYPSGTACPSGGSYPTGYSNCLSFTIDRPSSAQATCPKSVISYGVRSDGIVREDRTDYAIVGAVCTGTQLYIGRTLLTNVATGGQSLFTYFDRFGNVINPNASGQTTASFAAAAMVRVTVNVRYQSGSSLLSYTSDLTLRNNR